jgi:hypothetical protein
VYFKRVGTGAQSPMPWKNRPETGDIWRIHCTGPQPPVDGNVTTFILSPEIAGLPNRYAVSAVMYQNAPNPFADETTMRYQLSAAANVSLKIYNITGQLVKTLVDSRQASGVHSVRWNGNDDRGQRAATGVYLCQLKAGGRSVAKRMVLIR